MCYPLRSQSLKTKARISEVMMKRSEMASSFTQVFTLALVAITASVTAMAQVPSAGNPMTLQQVIDVANRRFRLRSG